MISGIISLTIINVLYKISNFYSFGALVWELLAARPPCHWTEADNDVDGESIFVFPFEEEWNVVYRNIISFSVQEYPEGRPDHGVLIELLCEEKHRQIEIVGKCCNDKENEEDRKRMAKATKLTDLHFEDLRILKKDVSKDKTFGISWFQYSTFRTVFRILHVASSLASASTLQHLSIRLFLFKYRIVNYLSYKE